MIVPVPPVTDTPRPTETCEEAINASFRHALATTIGLAELAAMIAEDHPAHQLVARVLNDARLASRETSKALSRYADECRWRNYTDWTGA
jgi:hypothetical protein